MNSIRYLIVLFGVFYSFILFSGPTIPDQYIFTFNYGNDNSIAELFDKNGSSWNGDDYGRTLGFYGEVELDKNNKRHILKLSSEAFVYPERDSRGRRIVNSEGKIPAGFTEQEKVKYEYQNRSLDLYPIFNAGIEYDHDRGPLQTLQDDWHKAINFRQYDYKDGDTKTKITTQAGVGKSFEWVGKHVACKLDAEARLEACSIIKESNIEGVVDLTLSRPNKDGLVVNFRCEAGVTLEGEPRINLKGEIGRSFTCKNLKITPKLGVAYINEEEDRMDNCKAEPYYFMGLSISDLLKHK